MVFKYKIIHLRSIYIFFAYISLLIFFFSTTKVNGKAFDINNIKISMPFEMEFNKNKVIDKGFRKAFFQLISLIVNSSDQKKINQIKLNEIKGMIETFSIKEEKFVNETYFVNLGVSFNKKKIFDYLEKKNIFPSTPIKKKLLFIPLLIDEKSRNLLIFSNNKFFDEWLVYKEEYHLIEYILPTEDLEDLDLLRSNFENIEQYDFKDITDKYDLEDSIIALIFKKDEELRILSRISIMGNLIIKNETFSKSSIKNPESVKEIVKSLQNIYEDYWKNLNQVNTSIKLPLYLKIKNKDNLKISNFEKILEDTDLIYSFSISKFDKDFTFYNIIFNGTPNTFLETMKDNGFNFDTQNKTWILK
tara:strand:+ start:3512 stop:4591 length:1080 start_codon:yes stop_codon:yes gene_type:complete